MLLFGHWLQEGDKVITGVSGAKSIGQYDVKTTTVPRGHVWLQGDNPLHSHDSRHYGTVPVGLILGKVTWKVG